MSVDLTVCMLTTFIAYQRRFTGRYADLDRGCVSELYA